MATLEEWQASQKGGSISNAVKILTLVVKILRGIHLSWQQSLLVYLKLLKV